MSKFKNKFFKYCVVGSFGTFVDLFFIYIFVDVFYLPVILSASISFVLAATSNFVFNNVWTFEKNNETVKAKYAKFMTVSIIGLMFTVILMYILNTLLSVWYLLAKVITSILVLIWNFYANSKWTFENK
jgi:putative flippase GtrA